MRAAPYRLVGLFLAASVALVDLATAQAGPAPVDAVPQDSTKPDAGGEDGAGQADVEPVRHVSPDSGPPSNDSDPGKPAEPAEGGWWHGAWLTGAWGGERPTLEKAGYVLDLNVKSEGSSVASRTGGRYLLDLDLTVDGEAAWGIGGATLFVEGYAADGRATLGSAASQGPSNIEVGDEVVQLSQAWWEQWAGAKRWRFKLGKVDANTEFANVAAAGSLLNGAAGYSPTIFLLPTYPNPALSLNVFHYPTRELRLGLAAYDGSGALGVATGSGSPGRAFEAIGDGNLFYIGELSWARSDGDGLTRRIAVGAWGSRTPEGASRSEDPWGLYGLAQVRLYSSPGGPRALDGFGQFGWSDPGASPLETHVALGLLLTAPAKRRSTDTLALYVSGVDGPGRAREVALELAYTLQLAPFFGVTLDAQAIRNPGGDPGAGTDYLGLVRLAWTL